VQHVAGAWLERPANQVSLAHGMIGQAYYRTSTDTAMCDVFIFITAFDLLIAVGM
jgi:hypothetical protein